MNVTDLNAQRTYAAAGMPLFLCYNVASNLMTSDVSLAPPLTRRCFASSTGMSSTLDCCSSDRLFLDFDSFAATFLGLFADMGFSFQMPSAIGPAVRPGTILRRSRFSRGPSPPAPVPARKGVKVRGQRIAQSPASVHSIFQSAVCVAAFDPALFRLIGRQVVDFDLLRSPPLRL